LVCETIALMQGLIQQFAKGGGPTRSLPVPFFSPFPFSPLPLPLTSRAH